MIFRLILQPWRTFWGDVEMERVRYILQSKELGGAWETVPVVMWDDLPKEERERIQRDLDLPSQAVDRLRG